MELVMVITNELLMDFQFETFCHLYIEKTYILENKESEALLGAVSGVLGSTALPECI